MRQSYALPDPLPWAALAGPLAEAEDGLARLDERLAHSPIRDGFTARRDFAEACACLWLGGELVHLEDLVLHDAGMDIRAPTHELTRAHAVLRIRRRIAGGHPGWALSAAGMDALRGRAAPEALQPVATPAAAIPAAGQAGTEDGGDLSDIFAVIDAAIASAERALAGGSRPSHRQPHRDPLVYDLDWHEEDRLEAWRALVAQTSTMPPVLAAAIAAEAWDAIAPLQHMPWLGRMLCAALLRQRGKTRAHLACLHAGMKAIPRNHRRQAGSGGLALHIAAMTAATETAMQEHQRWLTAHSVLTRKLEGRRSTSHLPDLIRLVMAKPIVSAGMIAAELKISQRAAQSLVAELGLREMTGRGRYRAWGII